MTCLSPPTNSKTQRKTSHYTHSHKAPELKQAWWDDFQKESTISGLRSGFTSRVDRVGLIVERRGSVGEPPAASSEEHP